MRTQSMNVQAKAALFCLLSLTLLLSASVGYAKEPPKPDLSLKDLRGKRVRLRDFRGKIVVLNLWATWCGPCREGRSAPARWPTTKW